jgi:AGZA family xanthine/uracil permease-like MFS transporter
MSDANATSDRGSPGWLERRFAVRARGSTVPRELLGSTATFLTLSYILFVQPFVMSLALPDGTADADVAAFKASVLTAVCLASALACLLMGLLANFPVALAPAMGHNFFFSLVVCKAMGFTWQQALGANLIAGGIFLVLSLLGTIAPRLDPRVLLFGAIPRGLQNAIGAGIGLLIALVGLEYAGIVIPVPGTYVGLGIGHAPWQPIATALFGVAVFGVLWARKVVGAPLLAIVASAALGALLGIVHAPADVVATPTLSATAFHLDFAGLFQLSPKAILVAVATFLFLDVFDTVGTLAGVCNRANLISRDGQMDKGVGGAFVADAAGTVAGALLGTSTITSYVESLAGVNAGARTGLAALGVAALFLLAMFFAPLFAVVAAPFGVEVGGTALQLYPCLAAVLIGIGALMLYCVKEIDWDDATEALPAFLCLVAMPVTFSITDGIAFGFIAHVVLKVLAGRAREVKPFIAVCAALLLARYFL